MSESYSKKLQTNLARLDSKSRGIPIFLVLGGSFNPPHKSHVEIFHFARDALRMKGFETVGGFMIVTSNEWVSNKLGASDTLPFEMRMELCNLTCQESDLVSTAPWCESNAYYALKRLKQALNLQGIMLLGSDKVHPHRLQPSLGGASLADIHTVCVRRAGDSLPDEERLRQCGILLIHRSDDACGANLSSTKVRELAQQGRWEELRMGGYMSPAAVDRWFAFSGARPGLPPASNPSGARRPAAQPAVAGGEIGEIPDSVHQVSMRKLKANLGRFVTGRSSGGVGGGVGGDKLQPVLLVLGGSFNPPHRFHVQVFHLARELLRGKGIEVVGGFLGVSSDAWVRGKLGPGQALPLERRVELCELACADSDLVEVVPWAEPSSLRTARMLSDALARWRVRSMVIAGSDAARIVLAAAESGAVCVRRTGAPLDQSVLELTQKRLTGSLGVHIIDQPDDSVGAGFSSTRARAMIKGGHWEELRAEGILCEAVVRRLIQLRDQDGSDPFWTT